MSSDNKEVEIKEEETNLLIPFPSDYDEKLKVSSLDPNTKIPIVQSDPSLEINYFDAREMIANLPRLIAESDTPEGVGELRISNRSKQKLINEIGNYESEFKEAYLNVTPYILPSIQNSLLLEEHRDRMKGQDGNRIYINNEDPNIARVQRLYGAINIKGNLYRLKTTLQVIRGENTVGKYHGYEITEIALLNSKKKELSSPKLHNIAKPAIDVALNNSSIPLAKLLKDVELSYEPNVKLLDAIGACHELKVTGNAESMRRVYEEARTKRLSTQLQEPLEDTIWKAKASIKEAINRPKYHEAPISIEEQRARISQNPNELSSLAGNEYYLVRYGVASNPNTPPDILSRLSKDKKDFVRLGVAENPSTPKEVLRHLSQDENFHIRTVVAKHPNAMKETKSQKNSIKPKRKGMKL